MWLPLSLFLVWESYPEVFVTIPSLTLRDHSLPKLFWGPCGPRAGTQDSYMLAYIPALWKLFPTPNGANLFKTLFDAYLKYKLKNWRDSTVGKALSVHMTGWGLIPSTTLSTSRSDSWALARMNSTPSLKTKSRNSILMRHFIFLFVRFDNHTSEDVRPGRQTVLRVSK